MSDIRVNEEGQGRSGYTSNETPVLPNQGTLVIIVVSPSRSLDCYGFCGSLIISGVPQYRCYYAFLGYFWKRMANPTTRVCLEDLAQDRILSITVSSGFPLLSPRSLSLHFSPFLHLSLSLSLFPAALAVSAIAVLILVKSICCSAHQHRSHCLCRCYVASKTSRLRPLSRPTADMFVFPALCLFGHPATDLSDSLFIQHIARI